MNFREGGQRFYAMVSLEGEEHWSIQDFTSISPKSNFKYLSAFTDRDKNINKELPKSDWDLNFSANGGTTIVHIKIKHKTLHEMEQMIQMGFQEGFTMTLNHLEILLRSLS